MRYALLALLAIAVPLSCGAQVAQTYRVGQKSMTLVDDSRNRPLPTEIWYPTSETFNGPVREKSTKDLFKVIPTIPNAAISKQTYPLLIVSHGTGGNRFSLTWFIETMVKEGYIVVTLDHYGNSTFNKIPREFIKWWERAIDVQFVLDKIMEDAQIGPRVDFNQIGGVGFSLGGYTNIALAGGKVDRAIREGKNLGERALPDEFPETEEVIDFENDSLILASYKQYKDHVKDDRFKAFFVMAPAIGFGFHSEEQVADVTAPIFIVAGQGDLVAPVESNAKTYHALLKTSDMHLFDESVGHYVFLNESTELGKQVAPVIAVDNPTVDRHLIHEQTLALAIAFFGTTLKNP